VPWPAPLRRLLLLGHVADALIARNDIATLAETAAPGSDWSATQLQQALAGPWQQLNATRGTPRAPA
jgi:hypothetical protein